MAAASSLKVSPQATMGPRIMSPKRREHVAMRRAFVAWSAGGQRGVMGHVGEM